jgi:hypothetical protein
MCQRGSTQPGMQEVHTPRGATRNHVPVSALETPTPRMRRSCQGRGRQPAPCRTCFLFSTATTPANKVRHWSGHPGWDVTLRGVAPTKRTSSYKVAVSVQPTTGVTNTTETATLARKFHACAFRHNAPHNSIRASVRLRQYSTQLVPDAGSWAEIPLRELKSSNANCFSQKHMRHGNRAASRLEVKGKLSFLGLDALSRRGSRAAQVSLLDQAEGQHPTARRSRGPVAARETRRTKTTTRSSSRSDRLLVPIGVQPRMVGVRRTWASSGHASGKHGESLGC